MQKEKIMNEVNNTFTEKAKKIDINNYKSFAKSVKKYKPEELEILEAYHQVLNPEDWNWRVSIEIEGEGSHPMDVLPILHPVPKTETAKDIIPSFEMCSETGKILSYGQCNCSAIFKTYQSARMYLSEYIDTSLRFFDEAAKIRSQRGETHDDRITLDWWTPLPYYLSLRSAIGLNGKSPLHWLAYFYGEYLEYQKPNFLSSMGDKNIGFDEFAEHIPEILQAQIRHWSDWHLPMRFIDMAYVWGGLPTDIPHLKMSPLGYEVRQRIKLEHSNLKTFG